MVKYRREFRRFRKSIWLALALLILLGLLLQNVTGSSYYSLLMKSSTAVSSPPVELQAGTAGTSTIYTNGTSALVSVEPSGAGTDVKDYVDSMSNVDGSADKGTHSNFENEKAKDNNYDALTETSTAFQWLSCNAYSSTYTGWTKVGTSPYLGAQDQPTNYIYSSTSSDQIGWFDFPSTTLTGSLNVNISIYCNGDGNDWADVWVDYTGSGGGADLGDVGKHTGWLYDTIVLGSHTVSEVNNLRVYFVYQKSGAANPVNIDHVRIGVSVNCELDLEVQWTSVDYDETFEFLCIYGGTMGAEDIRVDVWYSSAWQNVLTDLSSGWNNVSVTAYLTASTFTIRFKGGTESGDTTRHTWQIDAALLHVWSGNEVLGSATTVTSDAKAMALSYGKNRAVLRTTDPSNTLHVFQIESTNDILDWWKSTDNGQTWGKQISSGFGPVSSFSVKKDSNNYIHIAWRHTGGAAYYKKQYYTDTSWASNVLIDLSNNYQPDVAIAPYNNSWVYVVYDKHTTSGAKVNKVYVAISTNGGSSFGSGTDLTYDEYTTTYTAGTFPSVVIDNTLGTYGHIYVTWFRGDTKLYVKKGQINSDGSVTWDATPQTISSSMSTASTTENTNMMHSAMYANGKYRVVYCESGTAKYRHWDESSWSTPISLATVSHYPSITYDWNNYIYVFYHTNVINVNYDIRYMRSADTTPTAFGNAQNVTANNEGNRYVSAKLGGDNNRVEFAWTYLSVLPYQVKYNYITEGGGQGDFNHVLEAVEKDNSDWKVRLKAYDNSSLTRLTNCSIYIYDGSNSTQIVILNGAYNQQTGPWYDLAASDTEYIWMHVETSSAGTSYVYVYLEILVPNKTVYARYIITFKIT